MIVGAYLEDGFFFSRVEKRLPESELDEMLCPRKALIHIFLSLLQEIYELVPTDKTCKAEPVTRHLTGDCAIMNSTVFFHKTKRDFALAAGHD
ncbi:hypothetical protein HPB47_026532 [Ixodes persulcatus]|uniref:Uncharacterized protein n=1 Tax=Ixodes persulcatus TaxID=34615 RepID=A0AC60PYG3_IXOPE|nr:hypothetical protein HPB47_026532 [Ixodes persulcatus]